MSKADVSITSPCDNDSTPSRQVCCSHRLVIIGASNAARGIGAAVQVARAVFDGPCDLMAALGHGRSYGRANWVLGRWLPAIINCQMWDDLANRRAQEAHGDDAAVMPTHALVTDVGNDILYGATPEQIAKWVEVCVTRLQAQDCAITLTGIPLESLDRITSWEFPIFRSILYPGCFLTRKQALSCAAELNEILSQLAQQRGLRFVQPAPNWYGRDRIHIARSAQIEAWKAFLGEHELDAAIAPGSWREFLAIRASIPYHRRLFGFPQRRNQPVVTLRDGTRVSIY